MLIEERKVVYRNGDEWMDLVSQGWTTAEEIRDDRGVLVIMTRQYSTSLGRPLRYGESRGH